MIEKSSVKAKQRDIGKVGFGTTALLSLTGERERQDLLHAAFDAGITHFDTAPYYGYGEAEKILGRFIKDRRDRVTITTKFGIQPPLLAGGGSLAGAVKRVVKNLGPVRKLLARQAGKMVQRGAFGAADAQKSLEASLLSLQTDHIDVYLMHEAGPDDTSEELLAFLREKQRQGIIGRFGLGSEFGKIQEMPTTHPDFTGVMQFENSVMRPNLERATAAGTQVFFITHGALGGSFRELRAAMESDQGLRARGFEVLGADSSQPEILAAAMLAWAAQANPAGTVLFSSSRSGNLRANVQALRGGAFTAEQLAEFGRLAGAIPGADRS
jgi:D-threo-aldose 1-dehydrogenase